MKSGKISSLPLGVALWRLSRASLASSWFLPNPFGGRLVSSPPLFLSQTPPTICHKTDIGHAPLPIFFLLTANKPTMARGGFQQSPSVASITYDPLDPAINSFPNNLLSPLKGTEPVQNPSISRLNTENKTNDGSLPVSNLRHHYRMEFGPTTFYCQRYLRQNLQCLFLPLLPSWEQNHPAVCFLRIIMKKKYSSHRSI